MPSLIVINLYLTNVSNVSKHASADNVSIAAEIKPDDLSVVISDNGVGFDPELMLTNENFGLEGIQDLTDQLGGNQKINSKPGTGTTVEIHVPIKKSYLGK